MKLQQLIVTANKTYALGLDVDQLTVLYNRMRTSGYTTEVPKGKTSVVIDAILSMSDQIGSRPATATASVASEVYASMKVEAGGNFIEDSCPRCRAKIQSVKLVGGRGASYCQACHITLPLKVA